MNYVDHLNMFGIEAKEIPCIKGAGVPTTTTEGAVGLFYMDTNTGAVYKCTSAQSGKYAWEEMGSGSGSPGTTDHSQLTNRDLPNQHPIAAIEGLDETLGNTEEALDEIIAIQNEIIENGGSVPAGTTDHSALINRDLPDAHPMSAITGLEEAIANIPTGGGGVEPTEAEKIVDYVVDADSVSATEFTFTVAQYPKLAQYNHLRGIYKKTAHVVLPWSGLKVNNKQVAKAPAAGHSMVGFDIKPNKDFVYGGITTTDNMSMYHPWVNDTMFRGIDRQSLLPLRLGEITTISVFSYTSFLDEGGTIEIWGWND